MITEEQLIAIVANALGVEKDSINMETQSHDVAEWDSLGHLSILSRLQQDIGDDYEETQGLASAVSIKAILACLNKKGD